MEEKVEDKRIKTILRASIIAICVNVALGIFKAIVGFITNSIAITMDAINNFTDAISSFVTIFSAKMSSKESDRKHPFGYGRYEYLGTLLIGGLITYAGFTALIESIKQIISPEEVEYSIIPLVIVGVAVVGKLLLAMYISKTGKKVKSDSMVASGKEAIGDVAISISTLVAAGIYIFLHFSIEAFLGVIIAIVIIKSGIETLKETIDKLLGTGASVALVRDIKKAIATYDNVQGAFDLVMHDYGTDAYVASVHIAVMDTLPADELDRLTREIQKHISEEFGVFLSAIGIYSVNSKDEQITAMRDKVSRVVLEDSMIHSVHGFYINQDKNEMRFDMVVSFDAKDRRSVYNEAIARVKAHYPEYDIEAGLDMDFNEISD